MDMQKCKQVARKAVIGTKDAKNRVKTVIVPGTNESYRVILRRENGEITAECFCVTNIGDVPCKGNTYHLCYHARAAFRVAARWANSMLRLSERGKIALLKMNRCGGKLVVLRSRQSGEPIWGLV